jgi:hypothetical protein
MSFGKDLKRFEDKAAKVTVTVYRASVLDLFSSIVMSTPVDKGVLRGNWFVGIGSNFTAQAKQYVAGLVGSLEDKSGTATIGKIKQQVNNLKATGTVYLTNNLPYGPRIEFDGHSGKAPEGMVRINTARWDDIVKANVRKYAR